MKKLLLTSLAFALSGCGADIIFNPQAEDMPSCIVGTWNNEGEISSNSGTEAYSEFFTYADDGTFQHELRARIDPGYVLLYLLVGLERPVAKYQVVREVGRWVYQGEMLYSQITDSDVSFEATEEEALNAIPWETLYKGTPITDVTYPQVSGSTLHCDTQYMAKFVMKVINEDPLTYRGDYQSALQPMASASTSFTKLILNTDGSGTYETSKDSQHDNDYHHMYDITSYKYIGNILQIKYTNESGEETDRLFTDHGPVLIDGTSHPVLVRQ